MSGVGQAGQSFPSRSIHWLITSRAAYGVILVLGLLVLLPGFETLPAVDRDEARFAQSSRQMLETGDYFDIRLGDEARFKKPVGIYWLQAAATALAGGEDPSNPIWTYRLPSLMGALLSLIVTLSIGRRWFGAGAGFAAAALLAVSLMLAFEARQAKTDAFLLLTILVCVRGMADAWMPGAGGTRLRVGGWVAFWGAMGIGILVKGPIILLVTGLMAVVLSLHDRGVAWLGRLRPWPGILLTIAIAAPWLVAITIASHGAFLTQSVGADMAAKIAGGQESHGALPGAYLAMFPVTFWPGSLFALLALPWVWRSRRERSIVFAIAWVIPSWLVFEAIPTKLPHYVLPLYPGIALLTGAWLANAMTPPDSRWRRIASRAVLVLWAVIGVALGALVAAAAPLGDHHVSLAGAAAALALWVTAAGGAWVLWRGDALRAASVTIGGAVVASSLVFGAALPTLEAPWIAPRIKTILFDRMPAGHGPVMIAGYSEPSAMISLGTGTRFGSGADAAALLADDPTAVAVVAGDQAAGFSAALDARHVGAEALGTVDGFNYAKGKRIALTLWRRAP